ncbi:replication protein A 70 kDa DNA-binding subunit B-like isoform X2 [Coffea arabica]|uniref:ATP-dependent DNA helicase n=1 Tax=Coffea arabica TaxID=13443 RepID=A0ABM4UQC7_COFAR
MSEVLFSGNTSFFVDGPGGTGKTFLYRSLLATLRSHGHIAIVVASSSVAASILLGGRTAHSRFKIPLDVSANKICQISKQSSIARLIALAKLILWDEASMAKKDTVEAFDLLLKDVMDSNNPFGGKVVVFGGDFRQTLPVIPNVSRDQQIEASFVHSPLWKTLQKITLSENMRAISDRQYSEFLLRVEEGHEPEDEEGKISLHKDILIPFTTKDASLNRMGDLLFIDDIKPGMKSWTAIITVQEKLNVCSAPSTSTKWQKFIFVDSKGSKVQGVLFDYAIQKMGPKLKLYKKYRISNAEVRSAAERFQLDGLKLQWIISTKTIVEEIDEADSSVLPFHFDFTAYKDLPPYADMKYEIVDVIGIVIHVSSVIPVHKDSRSSLVQKFWLVNEEMNPILLSLWNEFTKNEGKSITELKDKYPVLICRRLNVVMYNGIALSTRNDSVILVNPPVREVNQLKHWAARNEKSFAGLLEDNMHAKQSPQLFHQSHQKIISIIDVVPTQKVSWVKAQVSFKHIIQKYYYMGCIKCHRMTAANFGTTFTCNHCTVLM